MHFGVQKTQRESHQETAPLGLWGISEITIPALRSLLSTAQARLGQWGRLLRDQRRHPEMGGEI